MHNTASGGRCFKVFVKRWLRRFEISWECSEVKPECFGVIVKRCGVMLECFFIERKRFEVEEVFRSYSEML